MSKKDSADTVLRELVRRRRRRRAMAKLQKSAAEGGFDLDFMSDKRNYRG
jgi:hypothetical protein